MNKLTRKLVLSVLTLVLSVVALGTTTFAWFSIGSKAEIQAFDVQATAGEGLEITVGNFVDDDALKASTVVWYSSIPSSVMNTYLLPMVATKKLDAVTSTDGINFKGFNNGKTDATIATTNKYLDFEINFRTRGNGTIKWNQASISGTKKEFKLDVKVGSTAAGTSIDSYLENALRISIVKKGETTGAIVYEKHDTSNGNTLLGNGDGFAGTGLNAHGYFTAKTGKTLPQTDDSKTVATPVNVNTTASTLGAVTGNGSFAYLTVSVRVWIEGWDNEAYDAIYEALANITLGFELLGA